MKKMAMASGRPITTTYTPHIQGFASVYFISRWTSVSYNSREACKGGVIRYVLADTFKWTGQYT